MNRVCVGIELHSVAPENDRSAAFGSRELAGEIASGLILCEHVDCVAVVPDDFVAFEMSFCACL